MNTGAPKSPLAEQGSWFCRWILGGIAVSVLLLWGFTYFCTIVHVDPGHRIIDISSGAVVCVPDGTVSNDPGNRLTSVVVGYQPGLSFHNVAAGTFSWGRIKNSRWRYSTFGGFVQVPLWMPLLVFAIPSAIAWERFARRRRRGTCAVCGYDLAGLPKDAPCPECGPLPSTNMKH